MTSIVFTRALVAGSPADLTITPTPGGAYWIAEDGITEPEIEYRITYAEDSPHVAGSLATQAVRALATLGLTIYTAAPDGVTLKAQKRALEAVVSQFTYTATLTTVGGADAYTCLPGRLSWGTWDSGLESGLIAKAALTIPVQPLEP